MTASRALPALALLAVLCGASRPVFACGVSATCTDVHSSISGEVIMEGFRVTFGTDSPDSTVGYYRVMRWPSGSPELARQIGDVASYVDCSAHAYEKVDTTVTSGSYVWAVQIWTPLGSSPECAYTVTGTIP